MRKMVLGDLFYLENNHGWNQAAIGSGGINAAAGFYWEYYLKHLAHDLGLGYHLIADERFTAINAKLPRRASRERLISAAQA